jgi:MoxR-like ATPase
MQAKERDMSGIPQLKSAATRLRLAQIVSAGEHVIVGKAQCLKLAFTCLIARGHLLIEDIPGVGKTTLAHLLARLLGLSFQRIQFTSDMLPADILGVSIYERETQSFRFHYGPIFSQLVLADEINRATPRAQSALLEAMEERQVTVEGATHPLPQPFFVIATQNPSDQIGTFPLPESQLDRFLMCISLGYPGRDAERELLAGRDRRSLLEEIDPVLTPDALLALQQQVETVHVAGALLDYVQALLDYSRAVPLFAGGLSPRAGIGLVRATRAWAALEGRDMALPEDVQAVIGSIAVHRLHAADRDRRVDPSSLVDALLKGVPIP